MDERLHSPYYHYQPQTYPPLPQHPVASNPRGSVIVRALEDGDDGLARWPRPGPPEPQCGGHGGRHASSGGSGGYYLGKNDDRLTYSSFLGPGSSHHRFDPRPPHPPASTQHLLPPAPASGTSSPRSDLSAVSPASLGDITYEQLEERLAQPSQMFRDFSHSLETEHRAPPQTDLNIDIDDIFAKFNYLVRGSSGVKTKPAAESITDTTPSEDTTRPEAESLKKIVHDHDDGEGVKDNYEDEEAKDAKRPVQPCHVCGDKAIAHLHYGGICCYSCKAFFRRAVQSGKDKMYKCKRDSDCEVSVNTRKGCQRCRLEKCLSIGMTARWVLSDEQCEIRFGKGKGGKRKVEEECERTGPPGKQMTFDKVVYSKNDQEMVDHMVSMYDSSWEVLCFSERNAKLVQEILNTEKQKYSASEMNSMVNTVIQRGIFAMNSNHHFCQLGEQDRKKLLTKNMTEMCLIRGALRFNVARKSFVIDLKGEDRPNVETPVQAEIKQDSLQNLYASEGITRWDVCVTNVCIYFIYSYILSTILQMMDRIKRMDLPTEAFIIMINIVGFASDGLNLDNQQFVEETQSHYMNLLYRY